MTGWMRRSTAQAGPWVAGLLVCLVAAGGCGAPPAESAPAGTLGLRELDRQVTAAWAGVHGYRTIETLERLSADGGGDGGTRRPHLPLVRGHRGRPRRTRALARGARGAGIAALPDRGRVRRRRESRPHVRPLLRLQRGDPDRAARPLFLTGSRP